MLNIKAKIRVNPYRRFFSPPPFTAIYEARCPLCPRMVMRDLDLSNLFDSLYLHIKLGQHEKAFDDTCV